MKGALTLSFLMIMSAATAFAQASGRNGSPVPETGATIPPGTEGLPATGSKKAADSANRTTDSTADGLRNDVPPIAPTPSVTPQGGINPVDASANGPVKSKKESGGSIVAPTGSASPAPGAPAGSDITPP